MKKLISLVTLFCFVFGSLNLMAYTIDEKVNPETLGYKNGMEAKQDVLTYLTESQKTVYSKTEQELKEETQKSIETVNEMEATGKITKTEAELLIGDLTKVINSNSIKETLSKKFETTINKVQTLDAEMAMAPAWFLFFIAAGVCGASFKFAAIPKLIKVGSCLAAFGLPAAILALAFIA